MVKIFKTQIFEFFDVFEIFQSEFTKTGIIFNEETFKIQTTNDLLFYYNFWTKIVYRKVLLQKKI